MATQGERLEALEKENGELKASVATLTEKVDQLAKDADAREDFSLMGEDGEPITAELVEGPDLRGDLLKAFRQIEAIANHINVRLPA